MKKNNKSKFFCILSLICLMVAISIFFVSNKTNNTNIPITNAETISTEYVTNGYIPSEKEKNNYKNKLKNYSVTYNANDNLYPDIANINCFSLRDEYVIYTEDQGANGLCWAYSTSTALSTTLMKATGQYYDFSEAWISLARAKDISTLFGSGANSDVFDAMARKYGLVLECDFHYEDSYIINYSNKDQIFEYYSRFANTQIMNNVSFVEFDLNESNNINDIKRHIVNNGAVSISSYWNNSAGKYSGINYINSKYSCKVPSAKLDDDYTAHAVCAIGWDDNITYKDEYNVDYQGAWICLNSWGESVADSVFYLFYNDNDLYNMCYGYEYSPSSSGLFYNNKIKEGTGYTDYITNLCGKYYSETDYTASTASTKQRNIFFNKSTDITYEYNILEDAKIDDIKIFFGNDDITSKFNINLYTETDDNNKGTLKKYFRISNSNTNCGTYKIIVKYSNATESAEYANVLYVMNGYEIGRIIIADWGDSVTGYNEVTNNGYFYCYNSYNYQDLTFTIATTKASGAVSVVARRASYTDLPSKLFGFSLVKYSNMSEQNPTQLYQSVYETNDTKITINIIIHFMKSTKDQRFTNIYYFTNGGVLNASNKLIVDKTNGLKLQTPSKEGYYFEGWYLEKKFFNKLDNNILKVSNVTDLGYMSANKYYNAYLKNSSIVFLYAKYIEKEPPVAKIKTNKSAKFINNEFSINSYLLHPLVKDVKINNIMWYLNDELIFETNNNILTQTVSNAGLYKYYVKMNVSLYEDEYVIQSDILSITVLKGFNPTISYSNGKFTWEDSEYVEKYDITVYYKSQGVQQSILNKIISFDNNEFDLLNEVSINNYGAGTYFLGIKATLNIDGESYQSNEVISDSVNFYKVEYITYSNDQLNDVFVEEGKKIDIPTEPTKTGYTFVKWCSDSEKTNEFDFQNTSINENTILYAMWSMNNISNINNISGISKTYNGEYEILTIEPTHESGLNNYSYVWYYQKDLTSFPKILTAETNNFIKLKNVNDSGIYYASVELTDSNGLSVTNETNKITVDIQKGIVTINTDNLITNYTYTGKEQTISTGATITNDDGIIITDLEISYEIEEESKRSGINKFIDVPSDGQLTLLVKVNENENYIATEKSVIINVKKANPNLSVESEYQIFTYNGNPVIPQYQLNNNDNTDQNVVISDYPINVNKDGYDIVINAQESKNYNSASISVHVVIKPANLVVKVNDISSILFCKRAKLSYSIVDGEVYNNDNLGITLSADNVDVNKLGVYAITLNSTNANYNLIVIEGNYKVTAWPYYLGFIILAGIGFLIIYTQAKKRYQYEFETNGGEILSPIDTKDKSSISLQTPQKDGYSFGGWYTDFTLKKPFNNKYKKSKGKVLYAKWIKNQNEQSVSNQSTNAKIIVNEIQQKINVQSNNNNLSAENSNTSNINTSTVINEDKVKEPAHTEKPNGSMTKDEILNLINKITRK